MHLYYTGQQDEFHLMWSTSIATFTLSGLVELLFAV